MLYGIKDVESLYAGVQRLRGILNCKFKHSMAPRFVEKKYLGKEKGLYALAKIISWLMR